MSEKEFFDHIDLFVEHAMMKEGDEKEATVRWTRILRGLPPVNKSKSPKYI